MNKKHSGGGKLKKKLLVAGVAVAAAGIIGAVAYTQSHSASKSAGVYVPPAVTKTSGCVAVGGIEDKTCTPGAVITTATKSQVCKPGYSQSVRNVPESEKNAAYAEYGIASHVAGQYEVDHLISLELGGSNDIANLWPELADPTPGFHQKDKVENYLHKQVCDGVISLKTAQQEISTDWLAVYRDMPAN
jgi:hypothetical protein